MNFSFAVSFAVSFAKMGCSKRTTQIPLYILSRAIQASTEPIAWILKPFTGSSTIGIAVTLLGRRFLGIDQSDKFLELCKSRREELNSYAIRAEYLISYRNKLNCLKIKTSVSLVNHRLTMGQIYRFDESSNYHNRIN